MRLPHGDLPAPVTFAGTTTFFPDGGQWHLRLSGGQLTDEGESENETSLRLQPVKGRHTEQALTRQLLLSTLQELITSSALAELVDLRLTASAIGAPLSVTIAILVETVRGQVLALQGVLINDGSRLVFDPEIVFIDTLHTETFGYITSAQLHAELAEGIEGLLIRIASAVPAWSSLPIEYQHHPSDDQLIEPAPVQDPVTGPALQLEAKVYVRLTEAGRTILIAHECAHAGIEASKVQPRVGPEDWMQFTMTELMAIFGRAMSSTHTTPSVFVDDQILPAVTR